MGKSSVLWNHSFGLYTNMIRMKKKWKKLSGKINNLITCWLIEGRCDLNFNDLKFRLTDNNKNAGSSVLVSSLSVEWIL